MRSCLVTRNQYPVVERHIGQGRLKQVSPPGDLYCAVDLDDQEYEEVRQQIGGLLDAETRMTVPVVGEPSVFGKPMDYHGRGGPLPTRVGLWKEAGKPPPPWSGEGVLVGTVDTGIQPHPWLAGGYLSASDDFEPDPFTPPDGGKARAAALPRQLGHGTFIAGLVLQQAPAAGVWVERALGPTGEGPVLRVAEAAKQLARRGVHVLNLSLGCRAHEEEARKAMEGLVAELRRINEDIVIVAAAGHLGGPEDPATPEPIWPAAIEDDVVAVGAVEAPNSTTLAEWSNRGPWLDFAAPAHDLLSTYVVGVLKPSGRAPRQRYHGWARWSGTSFATAVVSGAIASLMTQTDGGRLRGRDAVQRLREISPYCTDPEDGVPSVPIVGLRTWPQQVQARALDEATAGQKGP